MWYPPSLFQEGFTKVRVGATIMYPGVRITCGDACAWHIWGAQQGPAATTVQVRYDILANQRNSPSSPHNENTVTPDNNQSLPFLSAFSGPGTVLCVLHTFLFLTTILCNWCYHPHFTKKELKNWGSERLSILSKVTWEELEFMEELGFEVRQVSVTCGTSPAGCQ